MAQCLRCDGVMHLRVASVEGVYDDEKYTVKTDAIVCPKCGFITVDAPHLDEFYKHVADAYRTAHKLLTSTEIRTARLNMRMTQEEFAHYLSVGVASVKRWELGKVQEKGYDDLIRLKTNYACAAKNVCGVLINQGGPCDEYSGWRHFGVARFEQASLFFVSRIQEVIRKSKKKLHMPLLNNKLLWFADWQNVMDEGQSVTGLRYARIDHGPVPDDYRILYRLLQDDKVVEYSDPETLKVIGTFNPDVFTSSELKTLEKTWERFKNCLGKIEDLSHNESSCKETPMYSLIPFRQKMKSHSKVKESA